MSQLKLAENAVAPGAPTLGQVTIYAKTDGALYYKNDTGVEVGPLAGSAAATVVQIPISNGVTIAVGDGVSAAPFDPGRCTQSDAVADLATGFLGVCLVGGTGDVGGTVYAYIATSGHVTVGAGLTPGGPVYLSTTAAGALTSTVPSGVGNRSLRIGWAYSATAFVIHVGEGMVL